MCSSRSSAILPVASLSGSPLGLVRLDTLRLVLGIARGSGACFGVDQHAVATLADTAKLHSSSDASPYHLRGTVLERLLELPL